VSHLAVRVEIAKLAHELSVGADELAFLAEVPAESVRALRGDVALALFHRHEARFRRLARLSHLAPVPITAKIAEVAFGPLLGARVAAVMDPDLAVRLAARLSPGFLTDLAVRLDPVRAEPIIRGLPVPLVQEVGARLLDRGEHLVLGRFVSVVDVEAALAVVAGASPADLLQVALCTEDVDALEAVMSRLPDDRLVGVLEAGRAPESVDDLAALLESVSDTTRDRLLGLLDRT
jgi:hypothetical protein